MGHPVIDSSEPLLALAELFDCVEDALVWVKDRDGRYCWVNRAFLINYELDGREHPAGDGMEQIVGKTDSTFTSLPGRPVSPR